MEEYQQLIEKIVTRDATLAPSSVEPISRIVQLFRASDPRARSKLARIAGRYVDHRLFLKKRLEDKDDRVRANVVESLWGVNGDFVRVLLRGAAADPSHRVRMNALLGLY